MKRNNQPDPSNKKPPGEAAGAIPARGARPRWIPIAAPAILVLVLVPLVVGLVEVGLRLGGYGVSGDLFVPSGLPGHLVLNNDYYRRFHPRTEPSRTDRADRFNPVLMAHPKPDGLLRIMVIGGSTAKGFPYHDQHGFAAVAGALLADRLGGRRVEVVNLGRSAMSSYYVRETARRAWRYEPDLVLVYSGHNEYFGTIGAGSGPGHRRKLLYMRLKDLRVVQWLLNVLDQAGRGVDPDDAGDQPMTLMARRLAGGLFPPDEAFDRTVAERFLDNLEAVRRDAARRGIPLVVIDPVCNLLDMPPFAGLHAETLAALIDEGEQAVLHGEGDRDAWLRSVAAEPLARQSAHLLYLEALAAADGLPRFIAAKDADALPFRAREALRAALAGWAAEHDGSVHLVPLQQEMARRLGDRAFGDGVFIDHLHFAHRGQLLVGRIVADHLAGLLAGTGRGGGDVPAAAPAAPDDDAIRARIRYHAALDASALLKVRGLLRNPPFSDMRIPYGAGAVLSGLRANPLLQDETLRRRLLAAAPDEELQIVGDHLLRQERREELAGLLTALVHVNPGSHLTHLNLAAFLAAAGSRQPQLLGAFQRAYLLSHRDGSVRRQMEAFAVEAGLTAELRRFYAQIGE